MSQETTLSASVNLSTTSETKLSIASEDKSSRNDEDIVCCLIIADALIADVSFPSADKYFEKAAAFGSTYPEKYEFCHDDAKSVKEATASTDKGNNPASLVPKFRKYTHIPKCTANPRMYWEMTRISRKLNDKINLTPDVKSLVSNFDSYYKQVDKYIRAFIELHHYHREHEGEQGYARFLEENPDKNNYVEKLKSTENGSLLYSAGIFYETHLNNQAQAIYFFEEAAKKQDPRAHLKLGIYYQDRGKELAKARFHFEKAISVFKRLKVMLDLERRNSAKFAADQITIFEKQLNEAELKLKNLLITINTKISQIADNQPASNPKKESKRKKNRERQKAKASKGSSSINISNTASNSPNTAAPSGALQDTADIKPRDEEVVTGSASMLHKSKKTTASVTATSAAEKKFTTLTEEKVPSAAPKTKDAAKKSTPATTPVQSTTAAKTEPSTAKKTSAAAAVPKPQNVVRSAPKKEEIISNANPKIENVTASSSSITPQTQQKAHQNSSNNPSKKQTIATTKQSTTNPSVASSITVTPAAKKAPTATTWAVASMAPPSQNALTPASKQGKAPSKKDSKSQAVATNNSSITNQNKAPKKANKTEAVKYPTTTSTATIPTTVATSITNPTSIESRDREVKAAITSNPMPGAQNTPLNQPLTTNQHNSQKETLSADVSSPSLGSNIGATAIPTTAKKPSISSPNHEEKSTASAMTPVSQGSSDSIQPSVTSGRSDSLLTIAQGTAEIKSHASMLPNSQSTYAALSSVLPRSTVNSAVNEIKNNILAPATPLVSTTLISDTAAPNDEVLKNSAAVPDLTLAEYKSDTSPSLPQQQPPMVLQPRPAYHTNQVGSTMGYPQQQSSFNPHWGQLPLQASSAHPAPASFAVDQQYGQVNWEGASFTTGTTPTHFYPPNAVPIAWGAMPPLAQVPPAMPSAVFNPNPVVTAFMEGQRYAVAWAFAAGRDSMFASALEQSPAAATLQAPYNTSAFAAPASTSNAFPPNYHHAVGQNSAAFYHGAGSHPLSRDGTTPSSPQPSGGRGSTRGR